MSDPAIALTDSGWAVMMGAKRRSVSRMGRESTAPTLARSRQNTGAKMKGEGVKNGLSVQDMGPSGPRAHRLHSKAEVAHVDGARQVCGHL